MPSKIGIILQEFMTSSSYVSLGGAKAIFYRTMYLHLCKSSYIRENISFLFCHSFATKK